MPTAEVQGKLPLFPYLSAEAKTVEPTRAKGMLPSQEIHAVFPSPQLVPAKVSGFVGWLQGGRY